MTSLFLCSTTNLAVAVWARLILLMCNPEHVCVFNCMNWSTSSGLCHSVIQSIHWKASWFDAVIEDFTLPIAYFYSMTYCLPLLTVLIQWAVLNFHYHTQETWAKIKYDFRPQWQKLKNSDFKQETHHNVGLGKTPRRLIQKLCRYSSLEKFEDAYDTALDIMQTKPFDAAFLTVFLKLQQMPTGSSWWWHTRQVSEADCPW